jgi:hypothetical protein
MRRYSTALTLVLLSALATVRVAAQETEGPTVDASVGTAVQDRALQGAADSFPATVGTVYCFAKIGKVQPGTEFEFVWYHGTDEVGRVKFTPKASPWRTWSSKIIPPEATGDWRVDIVQGDKVLKSVSFKVQ